MFLHRWQIDQLIEILGVHASGFGLDEWIASLDTKPRGIVLPTRKWDWVMSEFIDECQRRGLLREAGAPHWSERCPHTPRCSNATNCENLQIIEAARKKRHDS